ncbi:MAG: GNAT family N-acetyltransferase [Bacteroidetes bacterium]|nr:MAG: GNAT family N-acetyltransferase [Bacteroidota bacterium]
MNIISINISNIEQEHICCAIGTDKENINRASVKKNWMKERFKDGLVFKRFDERGKVFIEYMPIEKVWKPIIGKNYMAINCLWVSGKFKGKRLSTKLLSECINDAKKCNMDGVAVVTSTTVKPFLTDKKFYLYNGFKVVDTAPPYFELLTLKFNSAATNPKFSKNAKQGTCPNKNGFTFIYSHQCPFMEDYVALLSDIIKKKNVPVEIKLLKTHKEAQKLGSPFGTLGIYYNGKIKLHELMTQPRFEEFVDELIH